MKGVWIEETDDVGYEVDSDFLTRISVSDGSWTLTAEQHLLLGSPMNGNAPLKGWAQELIGTVVTERTFRALLTLKERRVGERQRKAASRINKAVKALSRSTPLPIPFSKSVTR